MTSSSWRDQFVRSSDLRALGRHADLVGAVRHGELKQVIRGVYRYSSSISRDPVRVDDDAFLARVRAAHLLAPEPPTFSSFAAAAVWGLPILGRWPPKVHTLVPAAGPRTTKVLSRTSVGHPAPTEELDGVMVTSLARTVVDVGRVGTFGQAVAMADAALRGRETRPGGSHRAPLHLQELRLDLTAFGSAPGVARCRSVLDFADGASGSVGESASRVAIRLLGLPSPLLQVPFSDNRGLIGIVDFYWPELGLVGEFDGYGKYVREEFTRGRSIADIVMEEKDRENRLRALGLRVVRWDWPVARSLPQLRERLASAGLR